MMDFDIPTQPGITPPDAAIAAGDRLSLLWLYSGLAAAVQDACLAVARPASALATARPPC